MSRNCLIVFISMIAVAVEARILPETLVVCQCQFYPLREQQRGYLGRYVDQPLFLDPDLPLDGAIADKSYLKTWNSFYGMADLETAQRLAKDYGLDGFSFFCLNWRDYMWTAIERSTVGDFLMIPNIQLNHTPIDAYSLTSFEKTLKSTRGYSFGGKKLIVSYWTENGNPPERLKEKLDAARASVGDSFLYVPDLTSLCRCGEYDEDGNISPEHEARNRGTIRKYLRVADGIHVGATFNLQRMEHGRRVFHAKAYRKIVEQLMSGAAEPEFAGRKLIVLSALVSHENPTSQYHTPEQDGLRTLAQSLEIAVDAEPDGIVLPEWDEWNENTCFCPTLCNGTAVKRVMRPFLAKLRRQPLTPLAGDDTSVPNLIVSARKCVSPGGKFHVNVRNAPDGSRTGQVSVSVELLDEKGTLVQSFAAQSLDETKSEDARFWAASEDLAVKARALQIRLVWTKDGARHVVEGFHPVEISPANAWCVKEVHQPIRELAPVDMNALAFARGRVSGTLSCAEPLRYAMVLGDGRIQRIFGKSGDVRDRFTEDAEHAVFKVSPYNHDYSAFSRKDGPMSLSVRGVSSCEWLDCLGVTTGLSHEVTGFLPVSEPYFVRFPKADLATAELVADCPGYAVSAIPLKAASDFGAYILPGEKGASLTATRLRIQSRYPSPARTGEIAVDAALWADRPSMTYCAQAVTMDGRIRRSRPYVAERRGGTAKMRVYSCEKDRIVDLELPDARVPRVEYDFSPKAGAYVTERLGWKRFAGALGGIHSQANLYNRSGSGMFDRPEFLRGLKVVDSPVPTRERRKDGTWALVFDGVDDFVAFPWELIPQSTGYRLSFDIRPDRDDGTETLFSTKLVLQMQLVDGELRFEVGGADVLKSGLHLAKGVWHHVDFICRGDAVSVSVDGSRPFEAPVRIPGICMSSVAFGGSDNATRRCFKGALANLIVDHALERNP